MKYLIPLYHHRQNHSVFYDQNTNKLIRVKHHPRALLLFLLGVFIFYHIVKILDVNLNIQLTIFWRFIILFSWLIIVIGWMNLFYLLYFDHHSKKNMLDEQAMIQQITRKGKWQYRVECLLTLCSIPVALILSILFIISGAFVFLLISIFPIALIILFILSKPIKRHKILHHSFNRDDCSKSF